MDLLIEREGRFEQRTLTDGEHRLGEADGVPERLGLSLYVEGGRLSIEALAPVRVGGVLLPPRLRRLVMPGEPIEPLPGCVLRVRPELPTVAPATRAVVRRLLEEGDAQGTSSLVCLTGLDAGRTLPLGEAPLVIGRGDGADLRLRDRAVSRLHARVSIEGETHVIEDLKTANGVHVNGSRVVGRLPLEEGALVELGQTLLRYSSGKAAAPEIEVAPPSDPTSTPSEEEGSLVPSETTPEAAPEMGLKGVPEEDSPEASGESQDLPSEVSRLGPAADRAGAQGRTLLLASGALIFLVGIALTFGCLSLARGGSGAAGNRPAVAASHPARSR